MKKELIALALLLLLLQLGCASSKGDSNSFKTLSLEDIQAAADKYSASKKSDRSQELVLLASVGSIKDIMSTAPESVVAEEPVDETRPKTTDIVINGKTEAEYDPDKKIGLTSRVKRLETIAEAGGHKIFNILYKFGKTDVGEEYLSGLKKIAHKEIIGIISLHCI